MSLEELVMSEHNDNISERSKDKITLSITDEDKLIVKKYALEHKTTVSDLLHIWIQENCK